MRLRTRILAPARFEDENYDTSAAKNASKPAFPRLLKEQVIDFDPHLPPAAFPSLTRQQPQGEDQHRMPEELAEPADIEMTDVAGPLDHIFLPYVSRGGILHDQVAPAPSLTETRDQPVFRTSFVDDAATSDEDEDEIRQGHKEEPVATGPQSVRWTRLAPSLQVEIFENLRRSGDHYATSNILGLNSDEFRMVMKDTWARHKQVVVEDEGIRELQQAQIRAILRKDHTVRLNADSWRDHVAITRRHLPHVCTAFDYFICNTAEAELAKRFLIERGIDTSVLGEWGCVRDYGATDTIQTQAVQPSESREDIDSGYTSEVAEQDTHHLRETVGEIPRHQPPSEIPKTAPKHLNIPSSLRRKRPRSTLGVRKETVTAPDRDGDPAALLAKVPASARLQASGLSMGLPARSSHLTQSCEEAMALMKTRAGGFDDSDVSYEDGQERRELKSPSRLKINPPKPPRDGGDAVLGSSAPSPGERAITLKISPKGLQKVKTTGHLNANSSTPRISEVVTPPTMTSISQSVHRPPRKDGTRFNPHMPAARVSLEEQDQHKVNDFSWKLLEIQRSASALSTPPNFLQPPPKVHNHQTSTSPKRLKSNPRQDKPFAQASDGVPTQTPYGSNQLQRTNSTSSQEAPPWSPITQYSDSLSMPSSRKEHHQDKPQSYPFASANRSESTFQPGASPKPDILVLKGPAPETSPPTKTLSSKSSLAEHRHSIVSSRSDDPVSSPHFSHKVSNHEARTQIVVGSSQLFEPRQVPRPPQSNPGTPFRTPPRDILLNYGSGLLRNSPSGSKSPSFNGVVRNLAEAAARTLSSVKRSGYEPLSMSPAEQSNTEEVFSSDERDQQTTEKEQHAQLPNFTSLTSRPSLERQSTPGPSGLPADHQASSTENASKAPASAEPALPVSDAKKINKNGRVRPQTYLKSKKQIEKEAAARVPATSDIEKGEVTGNAGTIEVQKSDANRGMKKAKNSVKSGQMVDHQELVNLPNIGSISLAPKTTTHLPEVVTSSKLKNPRSGASKARKVSNGAADDDSHKENEESDTSSLFKKATGPKGNKVAVSPAKDPLQNYQTTLAMRGRVGKSALTGMAPRKKKKPEAKTVRDDEGTVSEKETLPDQNGTATKTRKRDPPGRTVAKLGGVETQETLSPGKPIPNVKDIPGHEQPSTPVKKKKKTNAGLTNELSIPTTEGEVKIKSFRGNQYLNADRTPRLNADGTPVVRKPRAKPSATPTA